MSCIRGEPPSTNWNTSCYDTALKNPPLNNFIFQPWIFHLTSYYQPYLHMHIYFLLTLTQCLPLFSFLITHSPSHCLSSPTHVFNQYTTPSACCAASVLLSICLSVCLFCLSVQYIPPLAHSTSIPVALLRQIVVFVIQTLIASSFISAKTVTLAELNLYWSLLTVNINGLKPTGKDKQRRSLKLAVPASLLPLYSFKGAMCRIYWGFGRNFFHPRITW